jgi:anti-sigma regulatory factor (Ser/Thr protein kinase)
VLWIVDAFTISLPANASSATAARTEVTRRLAERITSGALDDVRLLLTELITNSLRHGGVTADDKIGVKAQLTDGTVRIEVHDPGRDGPPEVRKPGPRGGGYGLFLVDRLTSQWGVDRQDGTTVWAELSAGLSR